MDVGIWRKSCRRTIHLGRNYEQKGFEEEVFKLPEDYYYAGESKKPMWKVLWNNLLKQKKKIIVPSTIEKAPYNSQTYMLNFDEGKIIDDEYHNDIVSRSFSARFADPSKLFLDRDMISIQNSMAMDSNAKTEACIKIPDIKFSKLFINGEFVDSISGRTFETIDPRTEEPIAMIAEGDKEDVDLAVKAAREAFDNGPWPRLPGTGRRKLMMKLADLIDENVAELAALDAVDAGKLYSWLKNGDIPAAAETLRYYAGTADKIHGETLKMGRELQGYTLREPIGVVGVIIPWNFPTNMLFIKVGPALAAGCTVVIKPSEKTPLSALFCAHLAKKAGIPDGVFNVIPGYGHTAGAAISSHMDIDKVAFTGSTAVGRLVMEAAAKSNLKPVSLELGGKSPFIVCDDADVETAANIVLGGSLWNKGEICVASSRILVQEGIYDEFSNKLLEKVKTWVVGDPFDPRTLQGPQVDKKQYDKILSYIQLGKTEGATVLTGGKPCGGKGYYIEPTVFSDVKDDMRIAREEIFGPVTSLMKFKTIEEAIKRGNATKYGLAAGILTKDINIANTISRSIKAGIIWINCYRAFDNDCPFGGYKMSGFGKDFGMQALDQYLQIKSVVTPLYNSPWL